MHIRFCRYYTVFYNACGSGNPSKFQIQRSIKFELHYSASISVTIIHGAILGSNLYGVLTPQGECQAYSAAVNVMIRNLPS